MGRAGVVAGTGERGYELVFRCVVDILPAAASAQVHLHLGRDGGLRWLLKLDEWECRPPRQRQRHGRRSSRVHCSRCLWLSYVPACCRSPASTRKRWALRESGHSRRTEKTGARNDGWWLMTGGARDAVGSDTQSTLSDRRRRVTVAGVGGSAVAACGSHLHGALHHGERHGGEQSSSSSCSARGCRD
jgi:hypothetical protein